MNMKRMRGRNHRSGGGGGGGFRNQQNGIPLNRNHVFDSSGPEMRVRGTAQQLYDKYTQLARDASGGGDRILAEAYYQHAEHYFRIIAAINQAQGQPNPGPNHGQNGHSGEYQRREGEPGEAQNGEPRQERQEPRQDFRHDQRRFDNNRQPRQDYQPRNRDERNDRQERQERQDRPFRPQPPQQVDAPIDISSALEAELQAAVAPRGLGEQPVINELPLPLPEPRAIPIIPDAPPAMAEEAAAPAAPVRRPRGRPRTVKVEAEPAGE